MKYLDRNYQCLLKLFQQTKETGFTLIPAMKSRASWICYDLEFQLRLVLNSLAKFNFNGACFARIGDLLEKWIDNLMILVIYPIFFGGGMVEERGIRTVPLNETIFIITSNYINIL